MFESDASASIYKGGMIRNKIQADQNAHAADSANRIGREWMEHAQGLEAELAKTREEYEGRVEIQRGQAREMRARGMTQLAISYELGCDERVVRRLLSEKTE